MSLILKHRPSEAELSSLVYTLYTECFLHTTLQLTYNGHDTLCGNTPEGEPVILVTANTNSHDPHVTLKVFGQGGFTLHSTEENNLIHALRESLGAFAATPVPEWQSYTTVILNVPAWFADPAFRAWLDTPEQRGFTYHRHGDTIAEFSDVIVMIDGLDGDASDMPAPYWRKVVQAAHAHGARSVRLTNMAE